MTTARAKVFGALVMTFTFNVMGQQQPQQRAGGPGNETLRRGAQLDLEGKGTEARAVFQQAIDTAPTAAEKANAERAMAMSWAFEGNCKKTAEYEDLVIDYWKTQEKAKPENAFYQEGEMANEAARVCIDAGDLAAAAELYKKGHDLGIREPDISPGRKALWGYRWEHAQARLAARRGNKAAAEEHVRAAEQLLEAMKQSDPKLYQQQLSFLPYLTGYIALYGGDYQKALADLMKANQKDPFVQCLIGMTYEKLGDASKAQQAFRVALDTHAHNPPAAFAVPYARKKVQ